MSWRALVITGPQIVLVVLMGLKVDRHQDCFGRKYLHYKCCLLFTKISGKLFDWVVLIVHKMACRVKFLLFTGPTDVALTFPKCLNFNPHSGCDYANACSGRISSRL